MGKILKPVSLVIGMIKREIRILGIDDSPFDKFRDRRSLVIGTFFRGGSSIDGVLSTTVAVDGNNATKKLEVLINRSKFKTQLRAVLLDGIAVAGFNVIDIQRLHRTTGVPVIVVMRDYPDLAKMKQALKRLMMGKKIQLIEKAGEIHRAGSIFIQVAGIDVEKAREIIRITCTRSNIPEPLRTAHLIAAGIKKGESSGKP